MCQYHLERANRALLKAIETPPETGREPRIDRIAASIWTVNQREECTLDPGKLCRLDRALATLETQASTERAERIKEARECLRAYFGSDADVNREARTTRNPRDGT